MSFADPDDSGWRRRNERHAARVAEFIAGQIGEPTLRACLMDLGFVGQALTAEINLAKMQKAEKRK